MDFFEQQHRARRATGVMVLLFLGSVAAIVAVLNLIGVALYAWLVETDIDKLPSILAHTPVEVYWITTGVTLVVIGFGTLKRLYELSGGGAAVASMVGARRVKRDSKELLERRLLNTVEEMALASGISVPHVYVMDEQRSINAFAAGYSPNEAVVVVTRGTLELLSRDELQGVIGHEFSHILNGDMRLNIRLMGVIAGIVMIGALGRFLMDVGMGRHSKDGDGDIRILVLGLVIWIIGSIGVFFGTLIKAAVSRQREFLADASSVQFTRNPDGIAGALMKIGDRGSAISQKSAAELSHMCIGMPVFNFADFDWFSTHPPIEQRIEQILGPGSHHLVRERLKRAAAAEPMPDGSVPGAFAGFAGAPEPQAWGRGGGEFVRTSAETVIASVGTPSTQHVDFARQILRAIPEPMREATGSPAGARAVMAALLLGDEPTRAAQLAAIARSAGDDVAKMAAGFAAQIAAGDPRIRVPLLELALPTLQVLEAAERDAVLALAKELVEADRRMTLWEFVLTTLCARHLRTPPKGPPPVKHPSLDTLVAESAVVLSLLAHAGRSGMPAFDKGMQALGVTGGVLSPPAELNFAVTERALYELKLLAPLRKPVFIKACLQCVMADERLTVAEGELMRAVCAAVDSPLPPILESAESVLA